VKNFFSFQRLISAAKKRKYGWGKHEKRKKSSRRAVELRPFSTRIALDRLKSNSVVIAGGAAGAAGGSRVPRGEGLPGGRKTCPVSRKHERTHDVTSRHIASVREVRESREQGDSEILYRIKNQNSLRTL